MYEARPFCSQDEYKYSNNFLDVLDLFAVPDAGEKENEELGEEDPDAKVTRCLKQARESALNLKMLEPSLESLKRSSYVPLQDRVYQFEFYHPSTLTYRVSRLSKEQIFSSPVEEQINRERAQFFDSMHAIMQEIMEPAAPVIHRDTNSTTSTSLWDHISDLEHDGWGFLYAPFQKCTNLWEPSEVDNLFSQIKMSTVFGSLLTLAHYYSQLHSQEGLVSNSDDGQEVESSFGQFIQQYDRNYDNNSIASEKFIGEYTYLRNVFADAPEELCSYQAMRSSQTSDLRRLDELWESFNTAAVEFSVVLNPKYNDYFSLHRSKEPKRKLEDPSPEKESNGEMQDVQNCEIEASQKCEMEEQPAVKRFREDS